MLVSVDLLLRVEVLSALVVHLLAFVVILVRRLHFDLLLEFAAEVVHFVLVGHRHLLQLNVPVFVHVKVVPDFVCVFPRERDSHAIDC